MVLEGGMTYHSVSMPLEDAQFLLLRGFQVDEICRMFRYPPHMVAKMDRSTFSNIEQQAIELVVYCLRPYLVREERSAARWLLKPADRNRFFVRFNLEGLLRGDAETRARFYAVMLQNGVYNRNEVRALENRNQVAGQGMDDFTVQSNMIDVDQLAALVAKKTMERDPARRPPAA
jgi:HK97 family phage portal protein